MALLWRAWMLATALLAAWTLIGGGVYASQPVANAIISHGLGWVSILPVIAIFAWMAFQYFLPSPPEWAYHIWPTVNSALVLWVFAATAFYVCSFSEARLAFLDRM